MVEDSVDVLKVDMDHLIFRVRREELPLRPQVSRRRQRGERNDPLRVRVRRSEVLRLLQDVRSRQHVAADQTGASGRPQTHPGGRRE